ncbi:uncharacterized protein [Nicotiana tomentosiformis]|uniref:SWIM-type domain-containing protein n=1 Tax=Nicotiana tabacum TaxID=4097 RepID=A0A1S4CQI8_TOBAC|nr:PREDICTED: uncharacterized protein LOC107821416 [Nicotiana tabacum]
MKKFLWWTAWSSFEEEFKDQLKQLGSLCVDAAKDLLRYPPQNWCRAYFDTVCKNQMVDNNFTESFNSWILKARGKLILKIIENIRIKIMNRLREKEEEVRTWTTEFSPYCMKLFTAYLKIANNSCTVNFNGDIGYEVFEGDDKHSVNLVMKKCTCRTWQLTGIPCPHAIKAMEYKKLDPITEINWRYSKEAYLMIYKAKQMHVRVGKPKVQRNREKDEACKRQGEWAQSRKGTRMTCSNCGSLDHNSRTCKVDDSEKGKKQTKRKKANIEEVIESEVEEPEVVKDVGCSAPQPT